MIVEALVSAAIFIASSILVSISSIFSSIFLSLGFVTPSLHLLHHSVNKKEHHRNYGTIFSFWDRMFCSYLEHIPGSTIRVGLVETGKDLPLKSLLLLPFVFRSGIKESTTKSVYNHKKFSEKVE